MKFLIAGLGSIGRRHLRNLLALGERDILLYRTRRATLPDNELAALPVETDLQAALAQRPDAVILSNPTALHLDVAIPAAEAGCHILLEKPISHSLAGVDRLQEAAAHSGSQILVGFQFRFHPGLQFIQSTISQQPSKIISIRAHWGEYLPNWHPWEDYRQGYAARPDLGGGVILTLCHPFDYLRWMCGEYEVAWALTSRAGLGLDVEDTAEIGLKFARGALGSLHLDYVQRPPKHTLELITDRGTIVWDNADGAVKTWLEAGGEGRWQTIPAPEGFERNVMFLDQMRHFLAVCRGEAKPLCTLEDGLRALELALQARSLA
jgi:predicted dehydrogenase